MLVKNLMQRQVMTVLEHEELSSVAEQMLRRGVRHFPVVREGSLVGVLSERNILAYRARHGRDGLVKEAMTAPPYTLDPDATIAEAAALMSTHKIGCVPVVDGKVLAGMITTTDLLTLLAQEPVQEPHP